MTRLALLLALLAALTITPAFAGTHGTTWGTGRISPAEFRATSLGATKYATQAAWDSTGALRSQWRADGHTYRRKLYRTTWGRGTWVWADYQLDAGRWLLTDKSWCVVRDIARTFSTDTYDCYDRPTL